MSTFLRTKKMNEIGKRVIKTKYTFFWLDAVFQFRDQKYSMSYLVLLNHAKFYLNPFSRLQISRDATDRQTDKQK